MTGTNNSEEAPSENTSGPQPTDPQQAAESTGNLTNRAPVAAYIGPIVIYSAPWAGSFGVEEVIRHAIQSNPSLLQLGAYALIAITTDGIIYSIRRSQ